MIFSADEDFAKQLDAEDPLRSFRDKFHLPLGKNDKPLIYFAGNSLGLMPKWARQVVDQELDDWAKLGVDAHLEAKTPWYSYHETLREPTARLIGAKPVEVICMNSLTVNLHLMMATFYRPTKSRFKVLMEDPAFPSDTYAIKTQIVHHGLDPKDALILASPRKGEFTVRTEDILDLIEQNADQLAVVLIAGVNFFTGQLFDIPTITKLPRLAGWFGNDPNTRFRLHLEPEFIPVPSADSWQISNPPIFSMAPLRASLSIFDRAGGMKPLRAKSVKLTGYLEFLLNQGSSKKFTVITPRDADARGCQLSILAHEHPKELFQELQAAGVKCDFREPDVIRVAPTPLYNTFHEVWRFAQILSKHHWHGGRQSSD